MYVEKTLLKQKMVEACIKKHQQEIESFKKEIRSLLESKMVVNEEDAELSQQAILEANLLADDIKIVNEEMHMLNSLSLSSDVISEKITLGSVVVTDKSIFFISGSPTRFNTNGSEVIGLSAHSSLFEKMKDKRKGDVFTFGSKSYAIVDIF